MEKGRGGAAGARAAAVSRRCSRPGKRGRRGEAARPECGHPPWIRKPGRGRDIHERWATGEEEQRAPAMEGDAGEGGRLARGGKRRMGRRG